MITNGPDKTIRANTVNCATTSKFIINLTLKFFINVTNQYEILKQEEHTVCNLTE